MRCWINISASAIKQNYSILQDHAGEATLVPIIKSNAYGHGLHELYKILTDVKPTYIGVNYLYEAKELRTLGFKGNILIVGPVKPHDLNLADQIKAEIFIGDHPTKEAWLASSAKPNIHVKFDTGMSRQGFHPENVKEVIQQLSPHKEKLKGICSHFANVEDVLEYDYAKLQLDRFSRIVAECKDLGLKPIAHISASASTLILKESLFDMTRVGISLYGLWPSQSTKLSYSKLYDKVADLTPALEWKTEVAAIKTVQSGQFIGYGCTYKAPNDMKVAVLPIGYYEGYPRISSNNSSYVLIKGQRCSIVGRICMNMMMVDVSHVKGVQPLDEVTLIGQDGGETLSAATVSDWAQTIHYEFLTRLCPEIPRHIVD